MYKLILVQNKKSTKMADFGYRFVSQDNLNKIVVRLARPTKASQAWNHDYDPQSVHVAHLKKMDPMVHRRSRSVTPLQLDDIVDRLHRPTTASTAKMYDFDHQDANLYFLKSRDEKVLLPFRSLTPSTLRGARATVSSGYSVRSTRTSVSTSEGFANGKKSGRSSASSQRTVSGDELDYIVGRISKPTVSSLGGAPLADKKYEYIPTPRLKTLPFIPGLDTKYMCTKKVQPEQFEDLVVRLTKPTKATISRSGPDPHVRPMRATRAAITC